MPTSQQDTFQRARERYEDAEEAWRENYDAMRDDLRFSNPADPQQWEDKAKKARGERITLTLDQTNQFIRQVVNDSRQNTPSLVVTPGDYMADKTVALKLAERLRYLEYKSRASITYDTAIEHTARCGIGWLRVLPTIVDQKLNYQEPRILFVPDPLAAMIDGDSVEYDGSDAVDGFVHAKMSERAFKRRWPKARVQSFGDTKGWFDKAGVRVAEWFGVEVKTGNLITAKGEDGEPVDYTEDDYHKANAKAGRSLEVIHTDPSAELGRKVWWRMMSGCEVLEEVEFPCKWIGLIPVYGEVLWVDGKRYVSGLTRALKGGQQFYNFEMSAQAELQVSQPKAPFMAPGRAIEGYEEHWESLNRGNPAYLPYNDMPDRDDDPPIAPPIRLAPPAFGTAFGQGSQMGVQAMQASVGMFKSVLGQQSNAVSGRAKYADKIEGDTATFHYGDNLRRSVEHLGRVLLDMEQQLNDTKRTLRTLSVDAKPGTIEVDPSMKQPAAMDENGKLVAMNPGVGSYDVRIKTGASYTTVREELKDRLIDLGKTAPALAAALTPLIVKLDDLPEADTIMRVCMALLPPQVQEAYGNGDGEAPPIPPEAQQQIAQLTQQLQQAGQMLDQMQQQLQQASSTQAEMEAKRVEAEAKMISANAQSKAADADLIRAEAEAQSVLDVNDLHAMVQKTRDDIAHLLGGGEPQPQALGA